MAPDQTGDPRSVPSTRAATVGVRSLVDVSVSGFPSDLGPAPDLPLSLRPWGRGSQSWWSRVVAPCLPGPEACSDRVSKVQNATQNLNQGQSKESNPKQLGSGDVRSQAVVDPSFAVWSPQRGATEGSHRRPG